MCLCAYVYWSRSCVRRKRLNRSWRRMGEGLGYHIARVPPYNVPWNHVLDGSTSPKEKGNFGGSPAHSKALTVFLRCTQNGWTDRDAVWGADSRGTRNHVLDEVEIPTGRGNFGGCPAHSKTLAVSDAVFAAKGIISSWITACSERDH